MNSKQEIQKELEALNSSLAHIEKQNIFKVEDGYFDELSEDIRSKTIEKRVASASVFHAWLNINVMKFAGIALLVLMSGFSVYKFWLRERIKINTIYSYDAIIESTDEDIVLEYISGNYSDLDQYIIEDLDESILMEAL